MYSSEVAKLLGIPLDNVKFYEYKFLKLPRVKRTSERLYNEKDINTIKMILVLRKCGVTLSNIECLFEKRKTLREVSGGLLFRLENVDWALDSCVSLIRKISKNKTPYYDIDFDRYYKILKREEKKGVVYSDISTDVLSEKEKIEKILYLVEDYKLYCGLFLLFLFLIFCLFDIVLYGKLDMLENVALTFMFGLVDYIFVDAFNNDGKVKRGTKLYVVNLIIVVFGVCLYNYSKVISNEYSDVDEDTVDFSVSKALKKAAKEKYGDGKFSFKETYAQGHVLLDYYLKDDKIYTFVVAKYGKFLKEKGECKSIETTGEAIVIVFDKVQNSAGAYNLNRYEFNTIPDKFKDKLNVDYNSPIFQRQINMYCKKYKDLKKKM